MVVLVVGGRTFSLTERDHYVRCYLLKTKFAVASSLSDEGGELLCRAPFLPSFLPYFLYCIVITASAVLQRAFCGRITRKGRREKKEDRKGGKEGIEEHDGF